jgi:hypothetical protein
MNNYRFFYVTNWWLTNNHEMRNDSGQSELGMIKIKLQTTDLMVIFTVQQKEH